jgi:GNAT superfamily N-acetyltransferase
MQFSVPDCRPAAASIAATMTPIRCISGAFAGNTLAAVATLCREPVPGQQSSTSWRLRGMVTLPEYRRRDFGRQLAQHCIAYAAKQEGTIVWCTSRITTVPFYRTLGFAESGEPFPLPQYGEELYIRMTRPLP